MYDSKGKYYSEKFIKDIENGVLKRKCLSNYDNKNNILNDDLSLFKYKRYIGSLRCLIDMYNMRSF